MSEDNTGVVPCEAVADDTRWSRFSGDPVIGHRGPADMPRWEIRGPAAELTRGTDRIVGISGDLLPGLSWASVSGVFVFRLAGGFQGPWLR